MAGATSEGRESLDPLQWVDAYGDVLYRYAITRVRRTDVAEDLVQETFLAALKAQKSFKGKSALQTWLIGILRHKIVDFFRQEIKQETVTSTESLKGLVEKYFTKRRQWKQWPSVRSSGDPAEAGQISEFWVILQQCLDELAPGLSRVFIMKEMDELSSEQVCKDLEITPSNLWVRMYRARMMLRECMDARWNDGE